MEDAVILENPVVDLVQSIVERGRLFAKNGGPLVATFQEGHPESHVLLIAGDNASGKSLMIRMLASSLNEDKIEPLQVSMKYRTMAGVHRAFMFGPLGDGKDSTGNISLAAIRGALGAAENRNSPCWVMLDEPDTGLADGYCAAMGTYLANFGNRVPLNACQGMSVVTHSRKLVSSMLFTLEKTPHFLCFSDYKDQEDLLQAWLEDERDRSIDDLLALSGSSTALFRSIEKKLNELTLELGNNPEALRKVAVARKPKP
jgi:hypothetical protein